MLLVLACSGQPTEPLNPELSLLSQDQSWIVQVTGNPHAAARAHQVSPHFVYQHAINGYAAVMPAAKAEALRRNPNVIRVEPDGIMTTQAVTSWGLDRIDQRKLPLDNNYLTDRWGAGVTAYIIDTGIKYSHPDFGGRARFGADFVGSNGEDCHGHGTHVAGTVGGSTYGVAKGVALVSVRVFGCTGGSPTSVIIAALDWVAANAVRPAVINMSLGGPRSEASNDAVARVTALGIPVVVAAGNAQNDACTTSPASAPSAITVGATDPADRRASFSNWGPCVDLFAPGADITSAWYLSTGGTAMSGTSMASPHAAGVAALYLQGRPSASAAEVSDSLYAYATKGVVLNALSENWHMLFSGRVRDDSTTEPPLPPVIPAPTNVYGTVVSFDKANKVTVRISWDFASSLVVSYQVVLADANNNFIGSRATGLKSIVIDNLPRSTITAYVRAYQGYVGGLTMYGPYSLGYTFNACDVKGKCR